MPEEHQTLASEADANSDGVLSHDEFSTIDADNDPTSASLAVDGDRCVMTGIIDSGTPSRVLELVFEHPEVKVIEMRNVPGSMDDPSNLRAARMIRDYGLATRVPANGEFAPGSIEFFLAAKERTVEPGGRLGVHSWGSVDSDGADRPREDPAHRMYVDFYKEMGIPGRSYWYTLEAAPADDIDWITNEEMTLYGVETARKETEPATGIFGEWGLAITPEGMEPVSFTVALIQNVVGEIRDPEGELSHVSWDEAASRLTFTADTTDEMSISLDLTRNEGLLVRRAEASDGASGQVIGTKHGAENQGGHSHLDGVEERDAEVAVSEEAISSTAQPMDASGKAISEKHADSVVKIDVYMAGQALGHGTGFYVDEHSLVTNHHMLNGLMGTIGSEFEFRFRGPCGKEFLIQKILSAEALDDVIVLKADKAGKPPELVQRDAGPKKDETI